MCLFIHLFMHSNSYCEHLKQIEEYMVSAPTPNHSSAKLSKSQFPGKKHKMTTVNNSTSNAKSNYH